LKPRGPPPAASAKLSVLPFTSKASPARPQEKAMSETSKFTRKQRRHLMIAFAAVTIATICIVFGGR